MQLDETGARNASSSKTSMWAGRIIITLLVLFLLFDGIVKVAKTAIAMEANARVGYPAGLVLPLGVIELLCVVLYVIPSTAVVGAILLTGYLGGAIATQVRLEDPFFLLPVVIAVLIWVGLFLREPRLRALIPVRR
jgi:hypothetical protein